MTSEYTLLDFADEPPVIDPDRHREILAELDERSERETVERLERLGVD